MLKKMANYSHAKRDQNNNQPTSLWLGFAFGAISAASLAFFLGTKKGRQMLKKILELSEGLEENVLAIAQQIENALVEKAGKTDGLKQDKPILENVLEKMKLLRN